MKSYLKKLTAVFTSLCMLISCLGTGIPVFAAGAVDMMTASVKADKVVHSDTTAKVTISMEGIPFVGKTIPTDVVLVIDRSGSMNGKLEDMVVAAKSFIDNVNLNKHRIGIVSYGSDAKQYPLSQSQSKLNSFLDTMAISGDTAMDLAIDSAVDLLKSKRANAEGSIVLMTDGEANDSALAMTAAENAKSLGYNFFTVALCYSETSVANQNLKKMATSETDHYSVFETSKLQQVYESIADKIGNCTAKNVVITQTIGSNFTLVDGSADDNIPVPTISGDTLTWNIPQLSKGISTVSYKLAPKAGLALGSYKHGTGTITYEDYNGDTQTITLDPQTISLKLYPPVITSVSPKLYSGKTTQTVTLSGQNFMTGAKLYLDNVLTPVISQTANSITFTAPVHADGKITVKVENPDGQADTDILYVGPNPTVSDVTPNEITEGDKVTVKITGANFVGSRTAMRVMFGSTKMTIAGANAQSLSISGTQNLAPDTYDITIYNSNGGVVTVPNGFTVNPKDPHKPTITSVTPNSTDEGKSVRIRIEGTNFAKSKTANTVMLGTTKLTINGAGENYITATVPNTMAAGVYDLTVINNVKQSATMTGAFTVNGEDPDINKPTITSVTPNSTDEGTSVRIRIEGTNFAKSKTANTVMLGTTKLTINGAGEDYITATVPGTMAAGVYDLTVTNNYKKSATVTGAFTVNGKVPPPVIKPTITSVTPNSTDEGKSVRIRIEGTNFAKSKTANTVMFGTTKLTINGVGDGYITATVPDSITAGVYDLTVTNAEKQSVTMTGAFTVNGEDPDINKPTIASVTPNSTVEGTSVRIRIEGTNFANSKTANTVMLGTTKLTVNGAGEDYITATVPSTVKAGSYDITVTCNGETVTKSNAFTVNAEDPDINKPTITSVTPNTTKKGTSVRIRIEGTNFAKSKTANTVMLGTTKLTINGVGDGYITATVPGTMNVGVYSLTVTNNYGKSETKEKAFEVT